MRRAISLLTLCLASSSLAADSDQETRIAKILHPDRTLAYSSDHHKVGGIKNFGTTSAKSKDFSIAEKFHPTSFNSENFKGTKTAWKGDAKFTTASARTEGTRKMLDTDKKATGSTKAAPVKEDWQSSKKAPTRDNQYAKREFLGPDSKKLHENTPQSKQNSWKGDLQPMTIDQVRDLLNKPRL